MIEVLSSYYFGNLYSMRIAVDNAMGDILAIGAVDASQVQVASAEDSQGNQRVVAEEHTLSDGSKTYAVRIIT